MDGVLIEVERTAQGCNVATRTSDGMVDIVLWCDEPLLEETARGREHNCRGYFDE
jgi:hypothetical protein